MSVSWISTTIWIRSVCTLITGWLKGRNLSNSVGYWCIRIGTFSCLYIHCPKQDRIQTFHVAHYFFFFFFIVQSNPRSSLCDLLLFVRAPFVGTMLRSWSILSCKTNCNYVNQYIRRQYYFKETDYFLDLDITGKRILYVFFNRLHNRLRFLWLL